MRTQATRRSDRRYRHLAWLTGVLFALSPTPAVAAEGSIPPEVSKYAADADGLIVALNDFYGVGADGTGIDFDESTRTGAISRVFEWTDAWLAGEATETPVERTNEWVSAISVNDKPLGVATLWINPSSVAPELAFFDRGVALASAFEEIPDDAFLVRDVLHDAWFTLEGTTLTVIERGTSGITGSTPLSVYQRLIQSRADTPAQPAQAPVNQGLVIGGWVLGGVVLAVVAILLIPANRRKLAGGEPGLDQDPEQEPGAKP